MNIFRKIVIVAVVMLAAFFGYSIWRHFHDAPVVTNALIDQQTTMAQQELKRTKTWLAYERRRAAKAEAAAARWQAKADSAMQRADSLTVRRAALAPPPDDTASTAVPYWRDLSTSLSDENVMLRVAYAEQKKATVLYQGLYVNTMRNLTDLGNAASGVNNALIAEHNTRQCKIAGLISCPSRGASYVAGIVTMVVFKALT